MGRQNNDQGHLFYEFRLDAAVPDDHLVRKIDAVLDLSWVHAEIFTHLDFAPSPYVIKHRKTAPQTPPRTSEPKSHRPGVGRSYQRNPLKTKKMTVMIITGMACTA